jgi:hypothetical protein
MGILKRRRGEPAPAPPPSPTTAAEFLFATISDWGRTLRFITIIICVLFVVVFSVTLGIGAIVMATEETRGIHPPFLLPTGIGGGATAVVWITISVTRAVKKKR